MRRASASAGYPPPWACQSRYGLRFLHRAFLSASAPADLTASIFPARYSRVSRLLMFGTIISSVAAISSEGVASKSPRILLASSDSATGGGVPAHFYCMRPQPGSARPLPAGRAWRRDPVRASMPNGAGLGGGIDTLPGGRAACTRADLPRAPPFRARAAPAPAGRFRPGRGRDSEPGGVTSCWRTLPAPGSACLSVPPSP